MDEEISLEEFLNKKRDYSPFLVHLTKDDDDNMMYAKDALDMILNQKTLKAYNHYCYFSPALNNSQNVSLQDRFKVVCLTETPIDQIELLLKEVYGRRFTPKPYGLVFKKEYIIKEQGGNPVFYVNKEIAKPFWGIYWKVRHDEEMQSLDVHCGLLALITVCEEGNDWHWEREWRIVGNLQFDLKDIYCGLCPEEDISHFENNYPQVKFISPNWGINKILDKLVGK